VPGAGKCEKLVAQHLDSISIASTSSIQRNTLAACAEALHAIGRCIDSRIDPLIHLHRTTSINYLDQAVFDVWQVKAAAIEAAFATACSIMQIGSVIEKPRLQRISNDPKQGVGINQTRPETGSL
jgi:chaperonin GroEL (HSP60 family)